MSPHDVHPGMPVRLRHVCGQASGCRDVCLQVGRLQEGKVCRYPRDQSNNLLT